MFEFKDHKIILDPNIISLPWFREIWDMDKSKEKEVAIHQLTYIFYLVDYKSPYAHYPETQRKENILKDFIKDSKFKETKEIKVAIEKYQEFLKTPNSEILEATKELLYKFKVYFKSLEFDIDGDPEFEMKKAESAQKIIGNMTKTLEAISGLEERVKKEKSTNENRRGGETTSQFED